MHPCIYHLCIFNFNLHKICLVFKNLALCFFHVISQRPSVEFSSVAQSCQTLCDPMDGNLPGSVVHGIFQARILEWAAISFSRGSSQPRDRTWISCIADRRFTVWATREALGGYTLNKRYNILSILNTNTFTIYVYTVFSFFLILPSPPTWAIISTVHFLPFASTLKSST